MPYKILGHTADVKLFVKAGSLKNLFKEAMLGMIEIISAPAKELKRKAKGKTRKIIVESLDANSLLIDFLNEVLYQTQVNREIYTDIKFSVFRTPKLKAEIFGHRVSEFEEDIKAATYHGEGVKKTATGFETAILFDI